jgi:SAM-dependent methyltransferase
MSPGSTPSEERLAQFKESVRRDWTDGATAWGKWDAGLRVLGGSATEAIVAAAQAGPGMQVLDLASGTGEPALSLARAVSPGGHVTATDLVPEMLAVARAHAAEQGLRNVTFQQADAEALQFADASFDRVTCRFGVMFFPNVDKALREIHRVLKPGGRAAFVAWGPLPKNPYMTSTVGVIMTYVQIPPPEPGAPTPFRFGQPGSLSGVLTEAGFQGVQEDERQIPWSWPGPPEEAFSAAQEIAAPAFRRLRESLPRERYEQAQAEILEAVRGYYDGQRVNFTATIVVATAQR